MQSPFLRLPRELRDMIYGFVIDTVVICVYHRRAVRLHPSLLQVCRQIRQEAQPYYHECTSVLISRPVPFDVICVLESCNELASFLRKVRVIELSEAVGELSWAVRLEMLSFGRVFGITIRSFPALETIIWSHAVKGEVSAVKLEANARYCFDNPDLRVIAKVPRNAVPQKLTMG